jgi:hypothetical protein
MEDDLTYNYKYLRARFKPKYLKSLNNSWLKISDATLLYDVCGQTIRLWAFRGRIKSCIFKNKIYVKNYLNY